MSTAATERGNTRPGLSPGGFGRAAILIGAITVVARGVGFGRQLVFAHTVRAGCLGSAYTTANMVPNIVYDVVLGGALTAVVVPVLAGPDPDGRRARQTAAALLTWTVLLLAPASVLVAVLARPVSSALLGGTGQCPRGPMVATASHLLMVFAPQIPLYGLAVVLYGIVQAHRRFAAPAIAPVLSSLVVIGTYFWFGARYGRYAGDVAALPAAGWILLAAGTTLGVAALALTPLPSMARLGLRFRPALRFPDGVGARVRALAAAGVATLIAQDISVVVVLVLANSRGVTGALVLYSYAWAVFFLPYAVLAVPIATSAFPELSELSGRAGFDDVVSRSTRSVLVASGLGVAALAGVCVPLARAFETHQPAAAGQLAVAMALFAPGLFGYGLIAVLSRVLYAAGRNRAAAVAVCGGWAVVIAADLLIVPFVPRTWVVPALGAGTSAGLCAAGAALLMLVRRAGRRPAPALAGCGRGGGRARRVGGFAGRASRRVPGERRGDRPGRVRHAGGVRPGGGRAGRGRPAVRAGAGAAVAALRVCYLLGTTDGGTGRHVRMLADGVPGACVIGPPATGAAFGFPSFQPVEFTDRPRPAQDVAAVRRLRRLLGSCDVVHAHGLRAGALAALALLGTRRRSAARRPALVVTVHNARPAGRAAAVLYRLLELIVARRAVSVLCVSRDLEQRMRAAGARRVGRAIVPAPAPGPPPAPAAAEAAPPETRDGAGGVTVLAVGRLAHQKAFDVLIDAAARWQDLSPAPRLAIAGEGPLAGDLAAMAARLGVAVDFLGRRADVPDLLAAASVFVLPSRWEGQALILQEALRAGAAVVATRTGGNPDLTGADAALLVPPDDPAALAGAVRAVLTDPALAARLRAAALDRARGLPTEAAAVAAVQAEYAVLVE